MHLCLESRGGSGQSVINGGRGGGVTMIMRSIAMLMAGLQESEV